MPYTPTPVAEGADTDEDRDLDVVEPFGQKDRRRRAFLRVDGLRLKRHGATERQLKIDAGNHTGYATLCLGRGVSNH